jgi:hypothetical protein
LGLYDSAAFNFQQNNLYFMGVTSSAGEIGSIVFRDTNSLTGDTMGIDNILFSSNTTAHNAVPEPAAALFGIAMLGGVTLRRYRSPK